MVITEKKSPGDDLNILARSFEPKILWILRGLGFDFYSQIGHFVL